MQLKKTLVKCLACIFLVVGFTAKAEEVIVPALNGMILELGNHAQQVQIRTQSLGPGFCAVEFQVGDDVLVISAPPFVWTDWMAFDTAYLSATSKRFSENIICATGALAELKYRK